jgi:NDP-sugar pyrophosphorylase family protein
MRRAVIMAGGKGARLAPYTTVFPKPLMPLGETPILEIVLHQLVRDGFEQVTLAVGHLAELIEAYFGDGSRVGIRLSYARERDPLGTAGPLALMTGLDEPFLMMNGDVLTTLDYGAFLDGHVAAGADVSVSTFTRTQTVDFGVVETDGGGRITGYIEKPESEYLVSMGVNAVSPVVLERLTPSERLDFPDLVLRLIGAGRLVRSVPFEGYWLDIGRHDDFEQAQREFAARRSEFLGA